MFNATFARSIAVLAIGLPALAQSAGGGLVSTTGGSGGTCVLVLAGSASGSWVDASAQKPGLLQGDLVDANGLALYRMNAQLLVGLLAAPVGAVPQGALIGDLYDLAAGPGAEPFAVMIGTWTRDSSVAGSFQASILDPASSIFAPVELGQIAGTYGAAGGGSGGGSGLLGSVTVASGGQAAAAGGFVADGGGVIIDYAPGMRELNARMQSAGIDPTGGPAGDPGSGSGNGSNGVAGSATATGGASAGNLVDTVISDSAPPSFGQSASSASGHAGQGLVGSGPTAGGFQGNWALCL